MALSPMAMPCTATGMANSIRSTRTKPKGVSGVKKIERYGIKTTVTVNVPISEEEVSADIIQLLQQYCNLELTSINMDDCSFSFTMERSDKDGDFDAALCLSIRYQVRSQSQKSHIYLAQIPEYREGYGDPCATDECNG